MSEPQTYVHESGYRVTIQANGSREWGKRVTDSDAPYWVAVPLRSVPREVFDDLLGAVAAEAAVPTVRVTYAAPPVRDQGDMREVVAILHEKASRVDLKPIWETLTCSGSDLWSVDIR